MIDITRSWISKAACRGQPIDIWFPAVRSDGWIHGEATAEQAAAYAVAQRICADCPVMHQCRRDSVGEVHGVWGGLDPHQRKALRRELNRRWHLWPEAVQLRYGSLVARLRAAGVINRRITEMTGFFPTTILALEERWRDHQAALDAEQRRFTRERVISLPTAVRPPWPAAMPDGDAWVWHRAAHRRAIYRAQSPEGDLLLLRVKMTASTAVSVWLPPTDVDLRRQVEVKIRVPKGRSQSARGGHAAQAA